MQNQVIKNSEPIPGYRVSECLGAGGYGEVWKAEAPGGLTKAIKFVYGNYNEKRATNESKSLDRIRDVRHPFLLSLERIEVVNGQLLIVSELADGSLRDRFNACRDEGLPGIPRDELMRCMHDTADALDFMSQRHSLQHLDVKPENLLLLSGRIKVADFGLVKNFRHVSASLVCGLTPVYAAPEVFRGKPSQCSDQYSLALVYQEMLTGCLPFVANTPAEMTLRHLNEAPDLSSLAEADRPAVARALAKDPAKRYSSCVEFVEALMLAGRSAGFALPPRPVAAPLPDDASRRTPVTRSAADASRLGNRTLVCGELGPVSEVFTSQPIALDLPALPDPVVRELGPLRVPAEKPAAPTLLVGVGGTAGHVLRQLRRRLGERFGNLSAVPAVAMLLLDTDSKSLDLATNGDDASSLQSQEVMELPLRRPQQYRASSGKLLHWLPRRWLYNIPRSLKTEGLRPLGRLAFVDHSKEIVARLRNLISAVTDPDAIARTAEVTNQSFRADALRVYFVTSISGGTGSGMILDLAYAVQSVRERLKLDDAGSVGVLMHSTGGNPRNREVAIVNAYSWLTEYNHFHRPGQSYPGDESCGLGASTAPAFEHTYLTHLGDSLGKEDLTEAAGAVADYVFLDLFTPTGRSLDACRATPCALPADVANQAGLRTFGLSHVSAVQHDLVEDAVVGISRDVVVDWLTHGSAAHESREQAGVSLDAASANRQQADSLSRGELKLESGLSFDLKGLIHNAEQIMTAEFGCGADAFYRSLLERKGSWTCGELIRTVNGTFGLANVEDVENHHRIVLGRPLGDLIKPTSSKLSDELNRWTLRKLDEPEMRLPAAKHAVQWLKDQMRSLESEATRLVSMLRENRLSLLAAGKFGDAEPLARANARRNEQLSEYFSRTLDECYLHIVAGFVRSLKTEIGQLGDRIHQLGRELEHFSSTVARLKNEPVLSAPRSCPQIRRAATEILRSRRAEFLELASRQVQSEFIEPAGGLHAVMATNSEELALRLRAAARGAALRSLQGIDLLRFVLPNAETEQAEGRLRSLHEAAAPPLLKLGGSQHLVVSLPESTDVSVCEAELRKQLGQDATVVTGPANELAICCEAAGLSTAHVAVHLIEGRRDLAELASRVQTRSDVKWSSLMDCLPKRVATQTQVVTAPVAALAVSPGTMGLPTMA